MVLVELLESLVAMVVGNVEGLSIALTLLVLAHYARKGVLVAFVFQHLRVVMVVLALLVLTPILELHPGAAIEFAFSIVRLFVGVLPI